MQVPRDLSRRMLEAAEGMPAIDVYERLMPENRRVNFRYDLISWLLAYAEPEMRALGLEPEEWSTLGDIRADPEHRWQLMDRHWSRLRTTAVGRTVLRMAWELFGIEDINGDTWKLIISASFAAPLSQFGWVCAFGMNRGSRPSATRTRISPPRALRIVSGTIFFHRSERAFCATTT